jgi:hypothetical protein
MIRQTYLVVMFMVAVTPGALLAQAAYGATRRGSPCSCRQSSAVPEQRSAPSATPPQASTSRVTITQVSTTNYQPTKDTVVGILPISAPSQTHENHADRIGPLYGKALSWSSTAGHSEQPANEATGPWYDHAGRPFQSGLDESHFFGY